MKTQSSPTLLINVSPLATLEAALELRHVLLILVSLGLCLILGLLTGFAKVHRESEEQHSLILPPPSEPAPPPPPADGFLVDYDESPESADTKLCNWNAETECGNVLELPRPLFLRRHRVRANNREYMDRNVSIIISKGDHGSAIRFNVKTILTQTQRLSAVQREALRQAEHLFASLLDRAFSDDLPAMPDLASRSEMQLGVRVS